MKKIYLLFIIFLYLFTSKGFASSDSIINKYQLLLDTAKSELSRANVYFIIAQNSSIKEKEFYYTKALQIYQKTHHYDGLVTTYLDIIDFYRLIPKHDKAIEYIQYLHELEESKQNEIGIAETMRILGDVYRSMEYYPKAFKELHNSLYIMEKNKNAIGIMKTTNRLSATCFERIQYDWKYFDSTSFYATRSYSIAQKLKDTSNILNNYNILGALFLHKKQMDSALPYFLEAYNILSHSHIDDTAIPNLLCNISDTYRMKNVSDSVIHFAKIAYDLATKLNIKTAIMRSAQLLADEYFKRKQFEMAYKYLYVASDYYASLKGPEIINRTIEIEQKYELKKFESTLQKDKLQKIVAYLILILFVLIIAGLYSRYSTIKKSKLELLESSNKIMAQNKMLEELNLTKDKFFSIIAHDLRNPIGNLINITDMLHQNFRNLPEKDQIEWLNEIGNSSKSIYALLENLLTWSRTQRNMMEYHPLKVDMNFLVDNIIVLLKPSAQNKNIEIKTNLSENFEVFTDVNFLNTILRNLISNAIKFTTDGGIVEITTIRKDKFVQIDVIDSGIGIPKENIGNMFKIDSKFYRKGTSGEPSSGLGLVLSKEFVKKMGGEIWLESEPGKGSKFSFLVPLA